MQRRSFLQALVATVAAVNMPSLAIAKNIIPAPLLVNPPCVGEPLKYPPGSFNRAQPTSIGGEVTKVRFSVGKGRDFESIQEYLKWTSTRADTDIEYVGEIYESQILDSPLKFDHCEYKKVVIQPAPGIFFEDGYHFRNKCRVVSSVEEPTVHRVGSYLENKDIASLIKRLRA